MKTQKIKQIINKTVESLENELVEFTQNLIRIPTENPPGRNYPQCAKLIGDKMKEIGCEVEYVEVPEDMLSELAPHGEGLPRVSVLGKYVGKKARPVIHFSGHYDVVPAGSDWSVDPYEGVVKDGKIYGRGASDQKSGIAAQIFAVKTLCKAGIELNGSIVSSATPDEETGGYGGMGYLVEKGYINSKNTDYCIITECLDVDKICLGHRGTLWFEIETKGKQSHGSMPSEGVNAIENMRILLNKIEKQITPELKSLSRHPIMPPKCRKSTLTPTMVKSGTKINTVPNSCKVSFDWRLIPEQDVLWAKNKIISLCEELKTQKPDFDYKLNIVHEVDPTIVPDNTEVVKAFKEAGELFLNKPMEFSISPGSDDQRFVVKDGNLNQCIVYGPGPLVLAHKSDEYIPIKDLKNAVKIMALSIVKLLGGEPL